MITLGLAAAATPRNSAGPSFRTRLQFGGADASTTFTDDTGKTWSAGGDAQIDTSLGDQRGYFDGSGDYISTPDHADLRLAADFVIAFTLRFNSKSGFQTICSRGYTEALANSWLVQTGDGDGRLTFYVLEPGAVVVAAEAAGTINEDQDYDIEIARVGTAVTIKRDGVEVASGTTSNTFSSEAELSIGGGSSFGYTDFFFNGWIKNFRIY